MSDTEREHILRQQQEQQIRARTMPLVRCLMACLNILKHMNDHWAVCNDIANVLKHEADSQAENNVEGEAWTS